MSAVFNSATRQHISPSSNFILWPSSLTEIFLVFALPSTVGLVVFRQHIPLVLKHLFRGTVSEHSVQLQHMFANAKQSFISVFHHLFGSAKVSAESKFGHGMLKHFQIDPEFINLNHGSFGAIPKPVQDSHAELSLQLERNPDLFIRIDYQPLLDSVRERVAELVGADTDDCVLVPNVANGISTVLRNFEWKSGDFLIAMDSTYNSVSRATTHIETLSPDINVGPHFTLRVPASHKEIVEQFREHLRVVKRQQQVVLSRLATPASAPKIVAIFDTIVSNPAVLLPWRDMVRVCAEEGVFSLVDAAHSIGQEVGINLRLVDPDFWVSSCSKWLYAKRGCALLYVPKRNQYMIKASLPAGLAYMSQMPQHTRSEFVQQFIWVGSFDPVASLSIAAALDFRVSMGGERAINDYCHSLAVAGGKRLAEMLGTSVMDSADGELTANMVNVELPLDASIVKSSADVGRMFQQKLLVERKAYGSHFCYAGKWWIRLSAQIYNEISDFERFAHVLVDVCNEITISAMAKSKLL